MYVLFYLPNILRLYVCSGSGGEGTGEPERDATILGVFFIK